MFLLVTFFSDFQRRTIPTLARHLVILNCGHYSQILVGAQGSAAAPAERLQHVHRPRIFSPKSNQNPLSLELVMIFSSWSATLEPYIDIKFNGYLTLILICTFACAVRSRGLLLLCVLGATTIILALDKASTAGEMIKTICVLPLGLGSVLAFSLASHSLQTKLLSAFTKYINFAVYGNIAMMLGTPQGGTFRGMCSKIACITLFVWIVQQGKHARWKTVRLHDSIFVFTAVSKAWIFAHAIYRFILLTLPCFGSGRRHCLLEVYSLSLTFAFSAEFDLPFEYCFGMADTLVVATVTAWSAIATTFAISPRISGSEQLPSDRVGPDADVHFGLLSLAAALFACFKIASAAR